MLYCTLILCYTILYYAVLCYILRLYTVLNCGMLHYTDKRATWTYVLQKDFSRRFGTKLFTRELTIVQHGFFSKRTSSDASVLKCLVVWGRPRNTDLFQKELLRRFNTKMLTSVRTTAQHGLIPKMQFLKKRQWRIPLSLKPFS